MPLECVLPFGSQILPIRSASHILLLQDVSLRLARASSPQPILGRVTSPHAVLPKFERAPMTYVSPYPFILYRHNLSSHASNI